MIGLIVAKAKNNVIGKKNSLPWYIPEDLRRFKQLTTGNVVVMGRNTYDSIIKRLGHPLPNRINLVVSTTLASNPEAEIFSDLNSAIKSAKENYPDKDIFLIGGQRIYTEGLSSGLLDKMFITEINQYVEGDTYFPDFEKSDWKEARREPQANDDYNFDFVTWERIKE